MTTTMMNRRDWWIRSFTAATAAAATTVLVGGRSLPTFAAEEVLPTTTTSTTPTTTIENAKQALLEAITTKTKKSSSQDYILQCIDRLVVASTSSSSSLDGSWKLIWSMGAEQFSPLLQLPSPFTPESYQWIGSATIPVVGENDKNNRIVQVLTSGILGANRIYLSSGIVDVSNGIVTKDQDSTNTASTPPMLLQILPPFRLEVEQQQSKRRWMIVDSDSDASFRQVNARTINAQRAPPNLYQQLYVDNDLRISKIIQGDPVILGATFIHIKEQ